MATAKIVELDDSNTCKICENALARYSCPRCNIMYCSLDCYQSEAHLECSEAFYKESVLKNFGQIEDKDELRKKMLEILQRNHGVGDGIDEESDDEEDDDDEIDSDDEEYVDISERLANVDLDDAEQIWEKLTEDERQEFTAFLKSDDAAKLISAWEPWWLYHNPSKVKDLSSSTTDDYKKNCPTICDIKDLQSITKKPAAACVKFNLVNILAAYVLATRYFNGEHKDFVKEVVTLIASLSLNLRQSLNFDDFDLAVKSVEMECANSDWMVTDAENIQIMRDDLQRILKGPNCWDNKYYVLCALSDLRELMSLAHSTKGPEEVASPFAKQFPNNYLPTVKLESADNIWNYIKKIDYLLSYAKDSLVL